MTHYRLLLFQSKTTFHEYVVIQADFTERAEDYCREGYRLAASREFTCENMSQFPLDVDLYPEV